MKNNTEKIIIIQKLKPIKKTRLSIVIRILKEYFDLIDRHQIKKKNFYGNFWILMKILRGKHAFRSYLTSFMTVNVYF